MLGWGKAKEVTTMMWYVITTAKITAVFLIIAKILFLIKSDAHKARRKDGEWSIIDGEYIVYGEEENR